MDYEEKVIALLNSQELSKEQKEKLENIFPELREREDERIRKTIYGWIYTQPSEFFDDDFSKEEMLAWVEKQGNKSVNIDVESMVSSYEQRLKSQGGTKYTPLVNMCLTSFRHGVENVLEELNLKKLEKQGEQKPTEDVKTLDANKVINWVNPDKVIEWLKNTIRQKAENYGVYKETSLVLPYNSIEDLINNFKEDFGL